MLALVLLHIYIYTCICAYSTCCESFANSTRAPTYHILDAFNCRTLCGRLATTLFVGMLASCFFDLQATAYYCCTLCPGICQYLLMDSFELYLELIWPQLSFLENWWWHNTDEQWSEATWHILHKSYSISSSLSHMTNTDIFFFLSGLSFLTIQHLKCWISKLRGEASHYLTWLMHSNWTDMTPDHLSRKNCQLAPSWVFACSQKLQRVGEIKMPHGVVVRRPNLAIAKAKIARSFGNLACF